LLDAAPVRAGDGRQRRSRRFSGRRHFGANIGRRIARGHALAFRKPLKFRM
jgi:hypothetical protein